MEEGRRHAFLVGQKKLLKFFHESKISFSFFCGGGGAFLKANKERLAEWSRPNFQKDRLVISKFLLGRSFLLPY